jgi:hypothetical protein
LPHSIEARHADRNLGGFLTVWDRIFCTHVADYECYPENGINDPNFPQPSSRSPLRLLQTNWRQLIYPFRHSVTRVSVASSSHDI